MDWLKFLLNAAAGVGGIAGLALGVIYMLQEKIIYVPQLPGIPNEYPYLPDQWRMGYEDVWLTTADGVRLHAWLMWPAHWGPAERRSRPTVMFFQENAGNMAFRLPFLEPLTRKLGVNAFILSYRGYGRSQGSPTERGLQLDAEAALDHVLRRSDIDPRRVVLFGRSLGGAVATYAACHLQPHISGLILENTFSRVVDLVPHMLPFLRLLVGPGRAFNFLVRNRWDTQARMHQLTELPILFLSSQKDEMLPPRQMRSLFNVHPQQPWSITCFPNGRHMDAYDRVEQYWPAVQQFMAGLQPAQPLPPQPPQLLPEPAAKQQLRLEREQELAERKAA